MSELATRPIIYLLLSVIFFGLFLELKVFVGFSKNYNNFCIRFFNGKQYFDKSIEYGQLTTIFG